MVKICRAAAQARLSSVTEFVKSLRPEHLQSFWYWASKYCFAVVGTFISLLWATAVNEEEASLYKEKLEEYRWTLRLSSKSAEILDRAAKMLATSTAVLTKVISAKRAADLADDEQDTKDSEGGDEESEDTNAAHDWVSEHALTDISMNASPTNYSDGAFEMLWQGFAIPPTGTTFQATNQYHQPSDTDTSNSYIVDTDIDGYH